jgi:hypothetical protein
MLCTDTQTLPYVDLASAQIRFLIMQNLLVVGSLFLFRGSSLRILHTKLQSWCSKVRAMQTQAQKDNSSQSVYLQETAEELQLLVSRVAASIEGANKFTTFLSSTTPNFKTSLPNNCFMQCSVSCCANGSGKSKLFSEQRKQAQSHHGRSKSVP